DRVFDYKIPEELRNIAVSGSRVEVQFGREIKNGFIVSLSNESEYPENRMRPIRRCLDAEPLIPPMLIKLGEWMSKYYCCSIEQAIKVLLPGVVRGDRVKKVGKLQYIVRLVDEKSAKNQLAKLEESNPKHAMVLKKLFQRGEELQASLRYELSISDSILKTLEKNGLISREKIVVTENPFERDNIIASKDLELTSEQAAALDQICSEIESENPSVILLNGVTGSGKTEVYLQAIRRCLDLQKQAVVLVPEIALTPQTVERFRSRFGDQVSVLHSGLGDRERFDEWMKIHENKVSIVVGARSALFAPFRKLGLIVVDEEHESTYKQGEAPRYHARDVAVVRGKFEKCTVLLGSATPAFETLYNVKINKYKEVKLTMRHDNQKMPAIKIVNLKNESKEVGGAYGFFSRILIDDIQTCLNQGEQAILFLNRRGFATSLQCLKCGYVAKCSRCDRAYTYHRKYGQIICHYCNDILMAPSKCPQCNDREIKFTGLGTEKIEEITSKLFPKASIARMDSDTMSSEKDYRETLQRFKSGKVDILIGTQMIAKGLHFPNVTLVGILMADLGLHIPDFRAGERTLQLITQVAGRAGRGEIPGRVLIQTLTPFHPALQHAMRYEYGEFFEEEMQARELFFFPPACHMILVHFSGTDGSVVCGSAQALLEGLKQVLKDCESTRLGEIIPSPIEKVADKYRYQLGIRTTKVMKVSMLLRQAVVGVKLNTQVKIVVDVDPYSLL
ncbi:MAG: replication restart helicase PriA, partial [Lentisphaeria bacterium]